MGVDLDPRVRSRISLDLTGCWLWTGYRDKLGYGRLTIDGKTAAAHRIVYEHHKGPIPSGLEIDHLCRVTSCVNPDHLEAVTHLENMRRGLNAKKAFCPQGHPYSGRNVMFELNGWRKCRECHYAVIRRRLISRSYERLCAVCGSSFTPVRSDARHCSKSCTMTTRHVNHPQPVDSRSEAGRRSWETRRANAEAKRAAS